jgi:hypothetical protein
MGKRNGEYEREEQGQVREEIKLLTGQGASSLVPPGRAMGIVRPDGSAPRDPGLAGQWQFSEAPGSRCLKSGQWLLTQSGHRFSQAACSLFHGRVLLCVSPLAFGFKLTM